MTRRNAGGTAARFVTITLNPAIDRTVEVADLRLGEVVRGRLVYVEPAGKGVNVAHTLAALGAGVTCTGFVGHDAATLFNRSFKGTTVAPDFVRVRGITRQSITILDRKRDQETHLTEQGFDLTRRDIARLRAKVQALAQPGTWVLANGRPAPGLSVEGYRDLLGDIKASGARLAVDTSGDFLRAAVEVGADFLKPNDEELGELVGKPLRSRRAILTAARELAKTIGHVTVSLGGRGAVCVTRRGAWHARERTRAPVVHTVGCGDALAAGFVFGLAGGGATPEALRLSVACGGACVRSPRAALRDRREVDAVADRVVVGRL